MRRLIQSNNKFLMSKCLIKNIKSNERNEQAAATYSNFKTEFSDYLVEDLLKNFSHFKTIMELQSILKNYQINNHCAKHSGPILCNLENL